MTTPREAQLQREYEAKLAAIKKPPEHISPGASEWLDDVLNTTRKVVDDAVKTVNDIVDTYIWDTTQKESVLEDWVRDTFDIPDQEAKGFFGDAWDKVKHYL